MMSFNDSVQKYGLKKKEITIIKFQQILSSVGLDNFDMYAKDGPFSTDIGTINLHPSK